MIERIQLKSRGQGTVEFALILGVLLVFIFTIVEAGRLFQGWLTVQNSARAGGRYALTGNSETECLYDFPACLDPRVFYIKDETKRTAAGLSIDPEAVVGDPGSFSTEVWSTDESDNWVPDDAGGSGDTVQIKVTYDMPIVVPLFWVIAESVPLVGQVTVTTEQYDQISTSRTYTSPRDVGEGGNNELPPQADLQITKSASTGVAYTRDAVDYTITVQNNGPFDAEDVVVVDVLPSTSTYIGASVPGGGYCDEPVGESLLCYLPNLTGSGPGSSVSFIINTLAPTEAPMNPTLVTNVASVSNGPATIDPYLGNNNTSVTIEVIPWADLSVSKSDNPDPVRISQSLEYTVNVFNVELNDAHNVYMQDELPAEVTFVSGTPNGMCSHDGATNVVTCGPVPLLVAGDNMNFTITVIAPPNIGHITNLARAWADEDDRNDANDETTESTNVTPAQTDLELYKEGRPFEHYAGETYTYTIDVYNNGPDDAPVVQIQDQIPAGLNILSISPSCSQIGNDVICDVGPIPSSGSSQVSIAVSSTITMVVDNDDTQILNTAEVFWGINQTDPTPDNNVYTAQNFVMPWVDLSIVKTATPEVYDGDLITYTLEVHNDGPFIAEDVEIWDWFPYPEGDTDGRYGSPECSTINNSYAYCQLGDLAIGATHIVTVVAAADWPGDSWNEAEVLAEEDDPYNPNDNEDEALTVILPRTELEVIKHAAATVYREFPFYYGLEVWNHGPSDAYGVQITDTLPVTVTYLTVYPSNRCSYEPADHEINCTFDIPHGERRWVWIRVSPDIESTIVNRVNIGSQEYDSDLANNTDVVTSTVAPSADLMIVKTGPSYIENINERIDYDIEVTNNGPSIATNITIVDMFPLEIDLIGNPPPSYCSASNNIFTCTLLDPLLPGESFSFGLKGKSTDTGYHTNTASVSGAEHEPEWGNNTDGTTAFVNAPTDISVDKQGPNFTYTGEVLPYSLVVYNDGDYTSHGVQITDTLPLTVTFDSADPGCEYNDRPVHTVTCDLPAIASKTTAAVTINVIPNETGTISNVAVVDGLETDPDTDNNTDTLETVIDPAANLAMDKTAPENVAIYETFAYTLTVYNGGPYTATNALVIDRLPDSVTFVSASAGCGSGAIVVCTIPEISPNESAIINIWVTADEYGTAENFADVSALEWDPDFLNNSDSAITNFTQAELHMTKTASSPAFLGEDLVYTLQIFNDGPSAATSVVVTDTLPSEVEFVSADTGCINDLVAHVVTCDLSDIPDQVTTTVQITVVPTQTGSIENAASVRAYEFESNLDDNTDTAISNIFESADLTLTKTAPISVTVGDYFDYQLVVSNSGPSDATAFTVTDTLPDEVVYLGDDSGCSQLAGTVTCTPANLAAGESLTFTIQVEALQYGTAANTAEVTGLEFDSTPENNSDSTSTSITEADLTIVKSGPASVTVFEEFNFSLSVTNDGPSNVTGVVVTDTLPAGLEYVSSDPSCSQAAAQVIVCTLGQVSAGDTVPVIVAVRSIQSGSMLNMAEVAGEQHDPDLSNNQDDHPVIVTQSDLRIAKSSSPAYIGLPFTYTLEIFNDGPSTAVGVIVTDTLPTDVAYDSDSAGCSYDGPTHSVICSSLPSIPFPGSISVDIFVIPSAEGVITNEAEVTNSRYDPDHGNNTVSIDTEVGGVADIEISVDGPAAILKDTWFTVTLTVTNNGPSDATGVIVTNTIEIAHDADEIRANYAGCTVVNAGMIICSIGTIDTDTPVLIDIGINRKSKDVYTNTAWVDGFEYDPIPANNTDLIVIDVQ